MTTIKTSQVNLINNELDINDRGLAYGDGLFETIAYVNGNLHNWQLHWQRLVLGARRLSLTLADEGFFLENINLKLSQNKNLDNTNDSADRVIKIILTRGTGGRGYQFPQTQRSSLIITVHNWPQRAIDDYQKGIKVKISQICLAQQPALAGIKHLNRLEQVLARNEYSTNDYQEAIMLACSDSVFGLDSRIIEATSSNLFFAHNGQLFTPEIDTCGVQGTIKQTILLLAKELSISLKQGHYTLYDLRNASEVFLTNSIFGIVPVNMISYAENNVQWMYSQQAENRFSARLSGIINKALNRPELL